VFVVAKDGSGTVQVFVPDQTAAGFSVGLVFNPMTVMAYTTLPASLRGEATSMQSLARNIGSAIGISITSFSLTRGIQATRIAHGVPGGGELEYVDGGTLAHALAGRQSVI